MANQQQNPLFSWLYDEVSASITLNGCLFSRHEEASAPEADLRLRLVYQDAQRQGDIAEAVLSCAQPMSLAVITRQNDLSCIELCLDKQAGQKLADVLAARDDIELLYISGQQPRLDQPGLLVMDMDSTAIQIECIDELAAMAGVGEAVAEVTERSMQGELDFEQSLRQRVAKLAGADAGIIDTLCGQLPLMPGLEVMVTELQSNGWRMVLASGGFTPFVGHLKQQLNLDAAYANELVVVEGKLKGEVIGTVVDAQFKADTVLRSAETWQIPVGQRLAIGDGANDIPMVQAADFGIAYHAKPKLQAAADAAIAKLDLRVLPFMLVNLA
ncbi:phosphoserine phosphatase SerB [Shewanella sp. Isolate7]|uniref:phosphoserine phosphatase SerB n=1 Tax=Shewanella sp. Isolate7 TaxID=2908528 RepID=UPI001EFE3299|nr:phosphoserine phosphatase SerB [Shewanella sp. Isolate7]MCG9721008.1 phosphoserine phosphatase SerB [Shewanella sp. Isolate7]